MGRLNSLLKNLKLEPDKFKEYDDIVKRQLQDGIAEIAPETADKTEEFYLPHKPVYWEDAESTKVRIVYDASAKATKDSLSQRLLTNRSQATNSSVGHSCTKLI